MHIIIGLFLSAAIGVTLGLIGGGGSIITVPVLVYVMDVEPQQAISMSLAVVGVTSLIGAALHAKRRNVAPTTGLFFGLSGVPSAYGGSRLTYLVPPHALMLSFAALMFIVAILMLVRKSSAEEAESKPWSPIKAVFAGAGVGLLTGFLGVGGGFLIVPALLLFGRLRMNEAIGTSLLVIAINCGAGLIGHMQYGGMDLHLTLLVTMVAATGALFGTVLSANTSPARLRTGFAVFVLVVAVFLLAKNLSI